MVLPGVNLIKLFGVNLLTLYVSYIFLLHTVKIVFTYKTVELTKIMNSIATNIRLAGIKLSRDKRSSLFRPAVSITDAKVL
jgi:hypothetical protein